MAIRKFRYYKTGHIYALLTSNAKHSETLEELTIYRDVTEGVAFGQGQFWCRPTRMFFEQVEYNGKMVDRFEEINGQMD